MVSLDEDQVRRAATALLKHVNSSAATAKGKPSLMDDEAEVVLAQFSLHRIPHDVSVKPIPIAIPHPLRQQEDCDICLIVKNNAKAWIKDMMEKEPVEGLAKVIKLDKLRTQYKLFKDRRELMSQYDLFLADDRILPMLTQALGKTFLKAKKQPVPISIVRRASLSKQIARARDSAFLVGSFGDCWAVKLATTAMTVDQVVENLMAGIATVVEKIPRKWRNVKAINIKCSSSVALPVYNYVGDVLVQAPKKEEAVAAKAERGEVAAGGSEESGGGAGGKGKKRIPRPLIRQQLNKIKEEAKAEKAAAAKAAMEAAEAVEAAAPEVGAKKKKKKRAASSEELVDAADEDSGRQGAGGKVKQKVKSKPESPGVDGGSATKATKRRRTAVA